MIMATGAAGMVGSYLPDVFSPSDLYLTDLRASPGIHPLDVRDHNEVTKAVDRVRPRLVIHLAAETDVDRCEREIDHAYRSNTMATLNVALACQRQGAELVYVSTAGVFDGAKPEPYTEFDPPAPVSVYARTKWEGEKIVQTLLPRHYIVRAGWMFGGREQDRKFVGKIASLCLGEGRETGEVRAVNDKFGSPTYAKDLLYNVRILTQTGLYGLYHIVNRGSCSRYDLAVEIARSLGNGIRIVPVSSASFPLLAPRPKSEAARSYKLDLLGLNTMRDWRDALREYLMSWTEQHAAIESDNVLRQIRR